MQLYIGLWIIIIFSFPIQGQSRPLDSSQNLRVSDEDNLEEVTLTVADGLKHGRLMVNRVEKQSFTPSDLDAGDLWMCVVGGERRRVLSICLRLCVCNGGELVEL